MGVKYGGKEEIGVRVVLSSVQPPTGKFLPGRTGVGLLGRRVEKKKKKKGREEEEDRKDYM
mgnify:CR=1 FL=1